MLKKLASRAIFKKLGLAVGGTWGVVATFVINIVWKTLVAPLFTKLKMKLQLKALDKETEKRMKKVGNAKTDNEVKSSFDDMP